MDFDFTPEQEAIRESVRAMMRNFPDSYWVEIDEKHEFPWAFYNEFAMFPVSAHRTD